MRLLELAGDHRTMGEQHGEQVRDLRPYLLAAMKNRLASLEAYGWDFSPHEAQLLTVWEQHARSTLEMLRGMASALELDWAPFFRYTIASYLDECYHRRDTDQGCTCWAAGPEMVRLGIPVLAKNRDYRPDHQHLQCLVRARPAEGFPYLYLTSAGSPAVFSSGMNSAGLAVADTHVSSLDTGPGVARYSAMMDVLEQHATVETALAYLHSIPHIGNGTLMLLDESGDMAVFETGYTKSGVVGPQDGFVVSTNHYVTGGLRDAWLELNPPALRGNSQARYAKVAAALQAAQGQVGVGWAQKLMRSHGGPLDSICRHPEMEVNSMTISAIIFLPRSREVYLTNGLPCESGFEKESRYFIF